MDHLLTPKIKTLLYDLIVPLNPGVPVELLLLVLETKLAHVLTFEKFVLNTPLSDDLIPVNMYSLVLYRSGGGKNRIIKQIDGYLLNRWKEKIQREWKDYESNKIETLQSEAEKKYAGLKTKQAEYIDYFMPRAVLSVMNDMTVEGFISQREMLQDWGKGSTLLVLDEFEDYFLSQDKYRSAALSILKSVYDTGDYEPKGIKGEKEGITTLGIASNCLFTASLTRITTGFGFKKMNNMLLSGYARRCFVSVPDLPPAPSREDNVKQLEVTQKYKGLKIELMDQIDAIVQKEKEISIAPDALDFVIDWKTDAGVKARTVSGEVENIAIEHMWWRTLKLAGVMAAVETEGKEIVITLDIIKAAKAQALFFHQQMKKLLVESNEIYVIYDFIKGSPGVSTMQIREQPFCPDKNTWKRWWDEAIEVLKEYCETKGEIFHIETFGKRGRKYYVFTPEKLNLFLNVKSNGGDEQSQP